MELVLSLFPGIDLLGRGFEETGYSVVRGPDILWGGDIRDFHVLPHRFDAVIGGSPCQDFSKLRRDDPTGYGVEMLQEFIRVVIEAEPAWFLLENVPTVPDIEIPGYSIQRFDLRASEVGLRQRRLRHFQYGSKHGFVLRLDRPRLSDVDLLPCVTASGDQREWSEKCRLQGLPEDFDLPGFSKSGKRRAIGNAVPLPMARFIAKACLSPVDPSLVRLCVCGCGRSVSGKQKSALDACRQRIRTHRKTVIARAMNSPAISHRETTGAVSHRGITAIDESQCEPAQHVILRSVTAQKTSQCDEAARVSARAFTSEALSQVRK